MEAAAERAARYARAAHKLAVAKTVAVVGHLRPDADAGGLRRVEIRPEIDVSGRIAHASGTYRSPFGEIRLRWAAESDGVRYEAQIPDAIDASFAFPGFSIVHTARTADGTRVFGLVRD